MFNTHNKQDGAHKTTQAEKQNRMTLKSLGTVFILSPLHFSCRKTAISTEQEYTISNTKSSHSAALLNGEHIAKLPYFARGRLEIKLQIYNSMLYCLYDLTVLRSDFTAHDSLSEHITLPQKSTSVYRHKKMYALGFAFSVTQIQIIPSTSINTHKNNKSQTNTALTWDAVQ